MSSNDQREEKRIDTRGIVTISPEEFERRLNGHSSTPPEERKRCPHDDCGSQAVSPRQPQKPDGARPSAGDYYCNKCHRFFDEPAVGQLDHREDSE